MRIMSTRLVRFTALAGLALAAGVAQAHTGHGTSGLSEGLAHPMGADHLLAMLAVGVWSVFALPAGKAWWGPAVFMSSLVLGAALGAVGVSVPLLEQMISMSVVLFGGMLILSQRKMSIGVGLMVVALTASVHGLAHGAETPETGFVAYAIGFLLTTAVLHFGGVVAGLGIRRYLSQKTTWVMAGLGTMCGAGGLYLFGQL